MLRVRDVLLVLGGAAVFGAAARADMMPVPAAGAECRQLASVCSTDRVCTVDLVNPLEYSNLLNLDLGTVQFVPEFVDDFRRVSETQHPQILTDGQSSLRLCLSALIGLGLCSSAHCLKKLHLGSIPEWYHNGGPVQIGHSLAVNPDTLCPAPVCCFVQPTCTARNRVPRCHAEAIVSLWRESQFAVSVLASRGPPPANP
jgi:hypothetical protein